MLQHITWRAEDNFQELVLSFHHEGPGDRTRVVRFHSRHLYPPGPSSWPHIDFYSMTSRYDFVLSCLMYPRQSVTPNVSVSPAALALTTLTR